ncbi:uncharacterized protein LOC111033288 [Myzus persicae]|uniref:uncharacterized protein LOC111033288 n=1 Tax=Myzus persicae TaxID=13164 RepID=UPI000B9354F4|nr:uncharacterized protein LOC111033288 [Myzus persicae]
MQICEHWLADGTFSCSPHIFFQLYTIHGVSYSNVVPTAYILLPNKKEETYKRMFLALKTLNPQLSPKSIMFDFEKGAMNAAKCIFPSVDIKGCFFHLCQSIWRHIQSSGLQSKYSNDSDFALNLRKLAALAYIPENDVVSAFETLVESQFYQQEMLSNLIDYFEDTWIGRLNRKTRRAPLFSIKIWNCYSMLDDNIPRTNNSVEGWHNSFNSMLSAHHPSIWTFITALKKEESVKRFKIEQYTAGFEPPKKKIYKDSTIKLKKICDDYKNRSVDDYLRGISHHFQYQQI